MSAANDLSTDLPKVSNINPAEFDITISALLLGIGAEKYLDIFRKKNIGQCTLAEMSDEDLKKIGIKEPDIRSQLIEEVKNFPLYKEVSDSVNVQHNLNLLEIIESLEESSQYLYRLYLSTLANTLAVKKTKNISDCLVYQDKYASEIAIATISEITNILNSMDIALHTELKTVLKDGDNNKTKKLIVGTVGGAAIAMLTVLFVKSLMDLK